MAAEQVPTPRCLGDSTRPYVFRGDLRYVDGAELESYLTTPALSMPTGTRFEWKGALYTINGDGTATVDTLTLETGYESTTKLIAYAVVIAPDFTNEGELSAEKVVLFTNTYDKIVTPTPPSVPPPAPATSVAVDKEYRSVIKGGCGREEVTIKFNGDRTFTGTYVSAAMGTPRVEFAFSGQYVMMSSPNHIMLAIKKIGEKEGHYHFDGFFVDSSTIPDGGYDLETLVPHLLSY